MTSSFAAGSVYSWCGPVCSTCHRGYLNEHECRLEDLLRLRNQLDRAIDAARTRKVTDCGINP